MRSSATGYIFGGLITALLVIAIWQRDGVFENALFREQTRELMGLKKKLEPIIPNNSILKESIPNESMENDITFESIIDKSQKTDLSIKQIFSWENIQTLFSSLKYFTFFSFIIITSSFILMI